MTNTASAKPIPRYDIYISGKMSGIDNFNREKFNEVAAQLRDAGLTVYNPGEIIGTDDWTWVDYMRVALQGMMDCHTLYVLNGYETSKGALIEIELASNLGMDIIHENQQSPMQNKLILGTIGRRSINT